MPQGLLSKGGTPLTPAQQQYLQLVGQKSLQVEKTFLPIQQHFENSLMLNKEGEKAQSQGLATASARTQTTQNQQTAAENAGQQITSGNGLLKLDDATNAGSQGLGAASAASGVSADATYAKGLQKVLSLSQGDQNAAQSTLQAAASAQAQEAGAQQAQTQAQTQGIGTIAGLAVAA